MSDRKRQSSKSGGARASNPPPPPARRKESTGGKSGATGKGGKSMASKTSNRSGRSKSRERKKDDGGGKKGKSQSRSKSRTRESPKKEGGRSSRDDKKGGGGRGSRSRSRPRSSAKPQDGGRSGSAGRQRESKRPSQKENKSSNTKSRSNGGGGGGGKNKSRSAASSSSKKRDQFASNAKKAIPASVRMISGCHDSQTSADVGKISNQFSLPNPQGRAGGACTAALLQVLYQSHESGHDDISWVDVLRKMRGVLDDRGFSQIPQLTSSRMIDVRDPFVITPTDGSFNRKNNTQRAVLIGINYEGQSGELSGCHNDVKNVAKYLMDVQGFKKENVTILMDDGHHKAPTKSAILSAYKRIVRESREGDVVFCHYSGHGGQLPDDNGDEEDGYDETLIPVDFKSAGQIRDDDLLKILVHPMPAGVTMTCLMDCCHSGTVLDLPYRFVADGDHEEMEINERTNFTDSLWAGMGLAMGMAAGNAIVGAVASAVAPAPAEMMILGGGPNAIHEYSDTDCCVIL